MVVVHIPRSGNLNKKKKKKKLRQNNPSLLVYPSGSVTKS